MKPEQRAREIRAEIAALDADYVQQRSKLTSELTMLHIHYGSIAGPVEALVPARTRRASTASESVPTTRAAKPRRNGRRKARRKTTRQLTNPKYANKRTKPLNVKRLTAAIQEQLTACFKSGMNPSQARKAMLNEQKLRIPAPRVREFWGKMKAQAQA